MFKKFFSLILIILIISQTVQTHRVYGQGNLKKVLIVYDKKTYFGSKDVTTDSISELFGHFKVSTQKKDEKDYKSGEVENYDYVFVIGIEGNFHNVSLITDLSNTNKTICWLGKGVEAFIGKKTSLGLTYNETISEVTEVYYTNKREKDPLTHDDMKKFQLKNKREFTILNSNNEDVKTISYISDGASYYPYIFSEKNFWYIGAVEDEGILFYILADVLYDILGETNFENSEVFIRIDDVHPVRDTNKLKSIAEYLGGKGIPFMISLSPFYKDVESTYATSISDEKEFIQTIKYMQKLGGSVILSGVTEAGSALYECARNDIYPLAFDGPYYPMNNKVHKEVKKIFSTYVGGIQSENGELLAATYPYKLYYTDLVTKLIPENLNVIQPENEFITSKILGDLDEISIVRGYTYGLHYDPNLDIKYLKDIVEKLEAIQVEFYDLKQEDNWVRWQQGYITSKNGEINVDIDLKKDQVPPVNEGYISNINNVLMVFIGLFCIIFLVVFYLSKRRNKKRFLR
ncbi:DUF2334 domain-containing protein [Clostridium sp. CS001]|uniref:DUF2334 domain-containing protein n=1 Tax=Clostridium sp. CS001 TaxID=2880648 RepID=UPI001CF3F6A9|nr:DUF2334 domain-containing protein [Clostridium sp. CS001]MCB2288600.1 DUF2334 domain-containing protein [Clostridium sp. CS001]